jgi:hypothetical protein
MAYFTHWLKNLRICQHQLWYPICGMQAMDTLTVFFDGIAFLLKLIYIDPFAVKAF